METDAELSRGAFHEHFLRECMHPYHLNINKMKREAYHKIDTYLRGFEAPEYLRGPATRRTYW